MASSYVYSDYLSVTNNTNTSLLVDFTALLIFFLFFLSFSCLGAGCRPGRFYFVFTFCSLILFCFSAVLLLLLLLWLFYSYSFLFVCHICGFYLQMGEAPVQHSKQYHKKALVSCYHLIDHTLGFFPNPQSLELPLCSSIYLNGHTLHTFTVCHLVH